MAQPMDLVFTNPLDPFATAGTARIVNGITGDGETTWFGGCSPGNVATRPRIM